MHLPGPLIISSSSQLPYSDTLERGEVTNDAFDAELGYSDAFDAALEYSDPFDAALEASEEGSFDADGDTLCSTRLLIWVSFTISSFS